VFRSQLNPVARLAVAVGVVAAGLGAFGIGQAQVPAADARAARTFEIMITNLTGGQIFSPPIAATHGSGVSMWQVGQPATEELRLIAEGGNTAPMAAMLKGTATDVQVAADPILPGATATLKITAADADMLSIAMMLARTNDGFTGVSHLPLTMMLADLEVPAYDAGTEDNTERASDVPAPPFGGMGHPATMPAQPITLHPGLTGQGEVGPEYNWVGAVARITVRQVE